MRLTLARSAITAIAVAAAALLGASSAQATAVSPSQNSTAAVAQPHASCPSGQWTVENSPGVWHLSPNASAPNDAGVALANGTCVSLYCYQYGAPYGPYGNTLWYWLPLGNAGNGGYINDHNLNTPGTAANPQPQAPHCPDTAAYHDISYYTAFNAQNSPGYWGNSPTMAQDVSGVPIGNGDVIGLACYVYGHATGSYNNILWYWADDATNHTSGYINDHFLTTTDTAANPVPAVDSHC